MVIVSCRVYPIKSGALLSSIRIMSFVTRTPLCWLYPIKVKRRISEEWLPSGQEDASRWVHINKWWMEKTFGSAIWSNLGSSILPKDSMQTEGAWGLTHQPIILTIRSSSWATAAQVSPVFWILMGHFYSLLHLDFAWFLFLLCSPLPFFSLIEKLSSTFCFLWWISESYFKCRCFMAIISKGITLSRQKFLCAPLNQP